MTIIRLERKTARRVRKMFKRHNPYGIRSLDGTVAEFLWISGRQVFTDKLIRRLFRIGAIKAVTK